MIATFKKYPYWSLILLGILMLLPGFAFLDVSIMEARNLITAREMITDNNWIMTTMNGEARYQKPPLPTWLTALFMLIFGGSKIIWLRLPGIIMVGICGLLVFKISEVLRLDKTHSISNALIAMTSFYVVAIVIEAPWDIYAHIFMGLSILLLIQSFQNKKNTVIKILISSLFFGASILSKGPVSVYALMLPFLLAYGFTFGYKNGWRSAVRILSVMVLGMIIGGWWYLAVRFNDPVSFESMASKETGNWSSYNVRPFYYYWSFFTQSGIWTIPALMGLIYPYMIRRVENRKAYRFSWLWTILAVILLSMIPEKKSRYLMPVLIPMAINTGFYLQYLRTSALDFKIKAESAPIYIHLAVLGLIGLCFPAIAYYILKSTDSVNWWHVGLVSVLMLAMGILTLRSLYRKRSHEVVNLMIGLAIALIFLLAPLSAYLGDGNYRPISELRSMVKGKGAELVHGGNVSPEFIWQYGDKIPVMEPEEKLGNGEPLYFLTDDSGGKKIPEKLYQSRLIDSFDLNRNTEGKGNYRKRLKVYLFELIPR